jgi:F0F1-type ATP synthase assembly protein I
MPAESPQSDQVKNARASLQLAFSVLGQVGLLTMGVIIVALVGGLWLDRLLSTKPLFTVLLMLASFPISYYIIYRIALNAVGKIKPAAGQSSPKKEDMQSDDNSQA